MARLYDDNYIWNAVFTGGTTATTTVMLQGASVFAVANAAAVASTSKLSFNMIGF